MFLFLKRLALFSLFLLVGLEVVFRTMVPAAERPAGFQDPEYQIMSLDQDARKDGCNSMGRLGRPRFAWHVNNFGFNSFYDYKIPTDREVPCVAVIGNSYVEGLYGDVDKHLAAQIQAAMGPAAEVYNLGTSGMPLSQCPRVVEYARDTFAPSLIIIQAGAGSVVRSLRENGWVAYCQQYAWEENSLIVLPPSRFSVNKRNRVLRKSALVRYLFYNSKFNLGGQGNAERSVQAEQDQDPIDPWTSTSESNEKLETAINKVLSEFRELVPGTPILIVFDADRAGLYSSGETPDRLRDSPMLERICRDYGIYFLDMTATFSNEYMAEGRKFNFEDNYHWNTYAVGIVASTIMTKLKVENLFGNGQLLPSSTVAE